MGQNQMQAYNQKRMMRKPNPGTQGAVQQTLNTPMNQSPQTMSMLQNRPMLRRPTEGQAQTQTSMPTTPAQFMQNAQMRKPVKAPAGMNIPMTPYTGQVNSPPPAQYAPSSSSSGNLSGGGGNAGSWTPNTNIEYGSKGNVVTGAMGNKLENPKAPWNANTYGIGAGNALQEGLNFGFQNLPTVNQENFTGLEGNAGYQGNTGRDLINQGGQTVNSGLGQLQGAYGTLADVTGKATSEADNQLAIQQQALAQQLGLQGLGLDPTLSANAQNLFGDQAATREANINARYDTTGTMGDQYGKQQASQIADLQNSGVLDSSTGSATLSDLASKLMMARGDELSKADEQGFADINAERSRVGEAAQNFGALQNATARGQGAVGADLLKTGVAGGAGLGNIGQATSGIGLNQQQLGQGMVSDANAALANALGLQMENRGQEGDMQLAELGQRLAASQGTLNNLGAQKDRKFQQDITEQQLALQQALANPSFWGGLGGDILGKFGFPNAGASLQY